MNLFLFFLNPVLGLISIFRNLNAKYSKFVFISFYAIYGYAISFDLESADFYRIGARFCQETNLSDDIWLMYMMGELTDVYLVFIYSILKPFTHNPKVLFGVFGLVYGLFSYLSVNRIYTIWNGKKSPIFYLIVFLFFLNLSFVNLSTVRFFTATSVFIYYAIGFIYFKKRLSLIGVVLTPLIHFGYLIGVFSFLLFLLLNHFRIGVRYIYFFMVLSFFISFASPQSFYDESDEVTITGSAAINRKAMNYRKNTTNYEKENAKLSQDQSLYRQVNNTFTRVTGYIDKIGFFLLVSFFYKKRKQYLQTKREKDVFKYVLTVLLVNYISSFLIFSGGRFALIANMFLLLWITSIYQRNRRGLDYRVKQLSLVKIYSIIFFFFNAPRFVTSLFWFAPPIVTLIDGIGFGPIDFV